MQIEKFNEQEDSTCVLYSINADESMELVKSLRVMAVPTILIYRHGILIKKLTGVKSAKSLSNTIAQVNTFDESQSKENEFKSLWSRLFGK